MSPCRTKEGAMTDWTETVLLDEATRGSINGALRAARNTTMLELLGNPRGDYSEECQEPTNDRIRSLIVTEDVGPMTVRGLRPAVAVLRTILADVAAAEPDLYGRIDNVGMLCCRFVRGSTSSISNHSWGTAVDLTIDGITDRRGDGRAQRGLLQLLPHFNRHGFYWGAAFPIEDAMHFEASDDLIRSWAASGEFGAVVSSAGGSAPSSLLEFGDRGPEVAELQRQLSILLSMSLVADGIFGAATRAAVIEFQRLEGLTPDGIVGPMTAAALEAALATEPA
jgi:hypothetical protein